MFHKILQSLKFDDKKKFAVKKGEIFRLFSRVFLVRESKSNPGAYVLTYKFNDKVFHAQIQPVSIFF